jgi:probable F420-dependent oxidoreductase
MRLGVTIPTFGPHAAPETIAKVSRTAEQLGYDSLWTGDRLMAPVHPQVQYSGNGGVLPAVYRNHYDPLAALTFAAAHTERVRLGTSSMVGLWQAPLMLARALTTVDVLARGRLDVGLGLGWSPDEYEAANVPWAGRGRRLEETLDVLDAYWGPSEVVAHDGKLFHIPPATVELKPLKRPPILLAAFTPAGLARIARRADGWLPVDMPVAYVMDQWRGLQQQADAAGRDPGSLRMALRVDVDLTKGRADAEQVPVFGTFEQYVDYVRRAGDAGIHELFLDLGQMPMTFDERVDLMGRFLEAVRR